MTIRAMHRLVGIVLLLPFFAWALTGFIFFIKPGYSNAYDVLSPRTYPLAQAGSIKFDSGWRDFRYVRTILGDHLIVSTDQGWVQLDPTTRQPRNLPDSADLRRLLNDAFSANPTRYGNITSIDGSTVKTDTGVEVKVDWNRLSLQQHGKDTDRIELLYRIHYLQWTGVRTLDKILGFAGLALVLLLTTLGGWLAVK
jgi:hypothetical protein